MAHLFQQPVGGLNVGTIEVEFDGGLARLNFKLYGEDEDTPRRAEAAVRVGLRVK